ncbi:restriction endonuclease subunit S [Flavobacterium suncheonense]|uniref:restriction endonuclease subunit S n=1 Tax=Flavobacterium suncheonense TaxID=350894 RepID=UPI0009DB7EA1|nr:restriction endonuclease subunit S [Flavobacterium suncheonense]
MSNILNDVVFYSNERVSLKELTIENYVTTDNLLQNKLGKVNAEKLPSQEGKVTKFSKGDILISNIRPYLKKIWLAKYDGGSSADVLTLKVRPEFDSTFIYYSLFRDDFFDYVMNGAKGTKMPRGDKNQILEFHIPNFEKSEQKRIAKVLSDLDAKIELNNKINSELEAMAKTLYDYWFVQFDFPDKDGKPYKSSGGKMVWNEELKREIPEGWGVEELAWFINNDKSGDWGKDQVEGNYNQKAYCVRGADINGLNGKGELKTPERYILEKNLFKTLDPHDLIVEISGGSPTQSTGRLAYITEQTLERFDAPIICSNFCKAVTLKEDKYFYNFVFQWNSIYDAGILFGFEGKTSGIKNLLFESFVTSYKTVVPPIELADKFYDFMTPIQIKKEKNLKENQELASLRDWLLPMLMNGQVMVGGVEEEMGMVAEETTEYGK